MLLKPVGNLQHNVLPALGAVEHTRTVGESACGIIELINLAGGDLQGAHAHNGLRHLLAVRADVLHRRPAHRSRNTAEAFQSCAILADGKSYQLVPILARAGIEENAGAVTRE